MANVSISESMKTKLIERITEAVGEVLESPAPAAGEKGTLKDIAPAIERTVERYGAKFDWEEFGGEVVSVDDMMRATPEDFQFAVANYDYLNKNHFFEDAIPYYETLLSLANGSMQLGIFDGAFTEESEDFDPFDAATAIGQVVSKWAGISMQDAFELLSRYG